MELIDEVVAVLEDCGDIAADCVGEDGFEDVVWKRLWSWIQSRCDPGGPWSGSRPPGWILLTSHAARQERDSDEWKRFQAAPGKLADAILLDDCFSRVDIVLRSPIEPEVTIGIEVERIRTPQDR
jgi:hypothetical protein